MPRPSGDSAVRAWLEDQPARDDESNFWDTEYQRRLLAYAAEQVRPAFEDATWQAFWQTAVEGKAGKAVATSLGMTVGGRVHRQEPGAEPDQGTNTSIDGRVTCGVNRHEPNFGMSRADRP